jgi:hypothetical protein
MENIPQNWDSFQVDWLYKYRAKQKNNRQETGCFSK